MTEKEKQELIEMGFYMLKDWKDSPGARIEHEWAKNNGLEIIYEE